MRALLVLALLSWAGLAQAAERLAVVFVVDGEPETADSLTEIVIARLAEQRGELVGLRELRGRLPAAVHGESIDACLGAGRCLSELRQASGAGRAVIGRLLRTPEGAWRLNLGLADTKAGTVAWRAPRALPAEIAGLFAGVRAAVDELLPAALAVPPGADDADLIGLDAPPAPVSPRADDADLVGLDAPLAPVSPPALVTTPSTPAAPPSRPARLEREIVGWGLVGLAAASFVTAAVFGHEAEGAPTGATRANAQADLSRREHEATAANVLWAAGGSLAAIGTGLLAWRW